MSTNVPRPVIVFGLNDLGVGGVQRQFVLQAPHFDRHKYDIVLITLFSFPERPDLYNALPSDIAVHRYAFAGWWDIWSWLKLYHLLHTLKPNVVISSLFFSNTVFRILQPFIGYRAISREHNIYKKKPFIHRFLDRLLAIRSFAIVAVSDEVAQFTKKQEHLDPGLFRVIENGIDLENARQQLEVLPDRTHIRAEFNVPNETYLVLNIARLAPQKNHHLLIDGFARFQEKQPHSMLFIVGGGSGYHHLLDDIVRRGLEKQVRLFGTRADVWRFYKIADVFASASSHEGLSNAYLEALASGLPLAITNTGGTQAILQEGENGCLIAKSTPEYVERALNTLFRLDQHSLRVAAQKRAEHFSIQRTVVQYETLIDEALVV
jgi:glycosyltransferase involved in cell wall biosynthesis